MNGRKSWFKFTGIVIIGLFLTVLVIVILQIPAIQERLTWRLEVASTYLRSAVQPAGALPTALPTAPSIRTDAPLPSATPTQPATATPTTAFSPTPTFSPTPIPNRVVLDPPGYEKQKPNNCGPATFTMYLRYYGWKGDQSTISEVIKPLSADRNVNVEEMIYYASNNAGWLKSEYRVGGDVDLLRHLLAAGIPVVVEESSRVDQQFARADDDFWDGHYLLITGYDDNAQVFITQDAYRGPNLEVSYTEQDKRWQPFNRVYILLFTPDQSSTVQAILGSDWDGKTNRKNALDKAQAETQSDPKNAFGWFNLGSNLVYFERYTEAALAYDSARKIGLPQRMLRYQFGPFLAYFHSGRTEDLLALTQYALKITDNSEEAWLWQGWALYRMGKKLEAVDAFNKALTYHPGYQDALYALKFAQSN
jgi:tetratricopeptide (TPR) repeat protein